MHQHSGLGSEPLVECAIRHTVA